MKTRTGKIARLPKLIREQLNQRLENGELGSSLVTWLNQLPEVQKIITDQFAGRPIRPQNLSEWRKGGYVDWLRHQLLREQTRWTAEQAAELGLDTTGNSISIAEDIATVMSAELAIHVQTMSALKNPSQRFRQFCRLSRELSRLRRDDQRAIRNQLLRKQPQSTPEPVEENSGTGVSPVRSETPVGRDSVEPKLPPSASKSPPAILDPQPLGAPKPSESGSTLLAAGGASVLASRALPETDAQKITHLVTPAGAPVERASVPDCGSPQPLSETGVNPNSCATAEQPSYNPPLPSTNSLTPKLSNSSARRSEAEAAQTPPQPSTPIRVNPHRNYYDPRPPIRGRRFVCIEG